MQKDDRMNLTMEKLADMRAQAQKMEDALYTESAAEFHATGKLNSPSLCEKTLEYENFLLTIEKAEQLLTELKQNP